MNDERVFTTGEVARMMAVATRLVCLWIDKGMLKGYRLPPSKHRYVRKQELIEFMEQHGMYEYLARYHPRLMKHAR